VHAEPAGADLEFHVAGRVAIDAELGLGLV
jgi:hypothetical protein